MKRRGAALVLVLLVTAFLLVVGFAVGDLCVVNLNMSRNFLASARARLLGRAAVEQFMVTFDQAAKRARSAGVNLSSSTPQDLGLRTLYANGDGLPDRTLHGMDGKVTITFDTGQPYYSVDNSLSESAATGWQDRGTSNRSVPPFSVDLMVTVELDGTVRHFEAVVVRRWPYAVFAQNGLVVICGTPQGDASHARLVAPSQVQGKVATLQTKPPGGAVSLVPQPGLYVVGNGSAGYVDISGRPSATASPAPTDLRSNLSALLRIEEEQLDSPVDAAVNIGPDIHYVAPASVAPRPSPPTVPLPAGWPWSGATLTESTVSVSASPSPGQSVVVTESGNNLQGDVYVPGAFRDVAGTTVSVDGQSVSYGGVKSVDTHNGNGFSGQVQFDAFPAGIDTSANPVGDTSFPTSLSGYKSVPAPPMPDLARLELQAQASPSPGAPIGSAPAANPLQFGFLFDTLTLDADAADNPPWQYGGNSRFVFQGDMGNRFVQAVMAQASPTPLRDPLGQPAIPTASPQTPRVAAYRVIESAGGLSLRNCTLYVAGNLDLSAQQTPGSKVGIEGSNAMLVVNGTLSLSGGHLDSRDQGMVICARDIILRASGDYRGLLVALNSLSILPAANDGQPASTLNIRGGVLCGNTDAGASLVIRSTNITYDPIYMKAVHDYGQATCTLWREVH